MADELTLKEALLDIVGGLKDPKQWQDTYEGLRRTRDAIPGVAESYIRGGLSQVAGQYGDLRDLATATNEFIPEKLRKVTSIAQFLSNPYLQTAINRAPTSEQVLETTPRFTPEHEGAKDVEMMGGWTAPGGAGVVRDLAKATKGMPIGAMMIGPESALWKPEMEFAARKLEAKKASKEQIRDATGLVRGLDKEWRTELGDEFSRMKDTESGGRSVSFGELAANQNPVNLQYPVFFDRKAKEVYGTGMPDTNKMTPEEFENFKEWRTGVVNEYEAMRKKGLTLGDVFKHDDLLKAYPEIADIRVEASGSPHFNGAFSMENGKPVIKINESLTPVQARSTMLHELQHYIQRKEGWGTGGNTGSYTQQEDARLAQSALSLRLEAERMDNSIPFEQRVEQASDMLNRLTSSDKFGGDVKKIALDTATNPTKELKNMGVLYGTDKNIEPYTPRKMYELMGGEAEARLIQARRDMTAEERANSFPFEYQAPEYQNMELMPNYKLDIKPEQAIIHGREPGVIEVGGKRISGEPVPGIEGSLSADESPYVSGVKAGEELIAHHNLNAEKLLSADKLGAMPVPSIAISKKGSLPDKFGEITLIGGKDMAEPSKLNPVYKSDAYTKTKGGLAIGHHMDRKSEARFDGLFDDVKDSIIHGDSKLSSLKDDFEDAQYNDLMKAKFLKEKGLLPNINEYAPQDKYKIVGDMNDLISTNRHSYEDWVDNFKNQLPNHGIEIKEKIFKGYSNSGNRRYVSSTLENIVKEMKGGAGTENWDYGLGNLRAKATPKFKKFDEIKLQRGRINPEEFEKFKKEMDQGYSDLTSRLSKENGRYSPKDALHEVAETKNINVLDRIYPQIQAELKADISLFMNKIKDMPTEYFEIKPQRAVNIGEFKGAIIPKNANPRVRKTLEKHGVTEIYEYETPEEKKSFLDKFGKHMFSAGGTSIGGAEMINDQDGK